MMCKNDFIWLENAENSLNEYKMDFDVCMF